MVEPTDALTYAREVYAACATIGYAGDSVVRLKALIDRAETAPASFDLQLATAAQRAHLEAADWAQRER